MKYNEFDQLNSILENKGGSLYSFINGMSNNLFEADEPDQLDTKSGNILTRAGRARTKLNNNAKKVQTEIMKNLYDKYYEPVLQNKKNIMEQAAKLAKSKTTIDEIKKRLQSNLAIASDYQEKQMAVLDKATDSMLNNYTTKINNTISTSKMSQNNKLSLSNYWVMLTSQLKLNLYNYIQQQELKFVDSHLNAAGITDSKSKKDISDLMTASSTPVLKRVRTQAEFVKANKAKAKESIKNEEKPDEIEDETTNGESEEIKSDETEVPAGESEEIKPSEEKEDEAEEKEDEPEEVEAEEVIVDNEQNPLEPGDTYTFIFNGKERTLKVISSDKNEMKFKEIGKDGKETTKVVPIAIASKMKFHKELPVASPPKNKKAIKTADTSSRGSVTHALPQNTESSQKSKRKNQVEKKTSQ